MMYYPNAAEFRDLFRKLRGKKAPAVIAAAREEVPAVSVGKKKKKKKVHVRRR